MKNHIPGKLEKSLAGFKFPTEINNEHPIIYRMDWHNVSDPSYYLALYKDGQVAGGVYLNQPGGEKASAITENGIISPNQWYAIKLIWSSGNKLKIYVNNDLKATSGNTLTLDKWNALVQRVSGISTDINGNVSINTNKITDL